MVRSLIGKHPQYYEAILQLREVSKGVLDFVKGEINKAQIPVAKTIKVKNGQDLYLADNQFTKSLGKKLQQTFGGELKTSASLFSKKDGKDIYRVTVLFRQCSFKKGDLVEYRGEEYMVNIIGKEILLQEVKTGRKQRFKYREIKEIKKIS